MRWLEHLRQDTEAYHSFLDWIDAEEQRQLPFFRAAKTFDGVAKVQGQLEALAMLKMTVEQTDKEQRHVAERHARADRERAGTSLGPRPDAPST